MPTLNHSQAFYEGQCCEATQGSLLDNPYAGFDSEEAKAAAADWEQGFLASQREADHEV